MKPRDMRLVVLLSMPRRKRRKADLLGVRSNKSKNVNFINILYETKKRQDIN